MKKIIFLILLILSVIISCDKSVEIETKDNIIYDCLNNDFDNEKLEGNVKINEEIDFSVLLDKDKRQSLLVMFNIFPTSYELTFGNEITELLEVPKKESNITYLYYKDILSETDSLSYSEKEKKVINDYAKQGIRAIILYYPDYYYYKKALLIDLKENDNKTKKTLFKCKYSVPGDYKIFLYFENYGREFIFHVTE